MKKAIIILVLLVIAGGVFYFVTKKDTTTVEQEPVSTQPQEEEEINRTEVVIPTENEGENAGPEEVIGTSAGGREIMAYHFGTGETELLFIGGIHGGYSWNTSAVAYELMDYLEENPDAVPENIQVTVVPVMNPDGLFEVSGKLGRVTRADIPSGEGATIPGRFNENDVDLNRNFDCEWQETGTWQSRSVSGGSEPFSEPESQAVRDYVLQNEPEAVVVWYSAAGGVFSSNCLSGVLPETLTLTNLYAEASGYKPYEEFNFYEITGDMVNWFAKEGVPGISVLLTDHQNTEWSKNQKGVDALLEYFAE